MKYIKLFEDYSETQYELSLTYIEGYVRAIFISHYPVLVAKTHVFDDAAKGKKLITHEQDVTAYCVDHFYGQDMCWCWVYVPDNKIMKEVPFDGRYPSITVDMNFRVTILPDYSRRVITLS